MDLSVEEAKDYRKGNWSVEETMVLIEAKKMDEERRMKRPITIHGGGKPPELRWKWVEDYCRRRGCLRSQNQCNDKWDNLMRDFKRVREYEGRTAAAEGGAGDSYWRIQKSERKDKNLPSNMLPEIYAALIEVTEKKSQRLGGVLGMPPPAPTHPPPPPFPFPSAAEQPFSRPSPTVDSDTSQYSDSPAKRKRRRRRKREEGTSGEAGGTSSVLEEVISKSGRMIAEAIESWEEREERREREMMRVHERRLQIEESKAEINRRGYNSLVDAINNLADSVFALANARHTNQQHSSK